MGQTTDLASLLAGAMGTIGLALDDPLGLNGAEEDEGERFGTKNGDETGT
jgi:hypothetical protein